MTDVAVPSSRESVIPPGPIYGVDDKTRRSVNLAFSAGKWLYKAIKAAAILGFVVSMTYFINWYSPATTVVNGVILAIIWFFIWGITVNGLFRLIVNPIRRMQFAALARRIDRAMVGLPLRFSLAAKWFLPTPGGIGVDPARRILFLTGDVTGYHLLFLRPHHILSAKVERKQPLHTVTRFSGSWGGVYGNGLTGGSFAGKARSTTTVNDEIFLEIQFRLAPHEAPRFFAVPFEYQRQWAESWVIAIDELRRSG